MKKESEILAFLGLEVGKKYSIRGKSYTIIVNMFGETSLVDKNGDGFAVMDLTINEILNMKEE